MRALTITANQGVSSYCRLRSSMTLETSILKPTGSFCGDIVFGITVFFGVSIHGLMGRLEAALLGCAGESKACQTAVR